MTTEPISKSHFHKIKYICGGISAILFIWLSCFLFIRSCGGPFPDRTRGPLAKYRYYQLSEFPEWENQILPDPVTGRNRVEDLIEKGTMNPIRFGDPFAGKSAIRSATSGAQVSSPTQANP